MTILRETERWLKIQNQPKNMNGDERRINMVTNAKFCTSDLVQRYMYFKACVLEVLDILQHVLQTPSADQQI